jgi:hypothetical protein
MQVRLIRREAASSRNGLIKRGVNAAVAGDFVQ